MIDESHQPDKRWVLAVLSTIAPKDEIFDKNYIPPSKPKASKIYKSVDLPASFLKGLPISKRKIKTRRLKLMTGGAQTAKVMRLQDAKLRCET